jgi:hypothetical protein
LILELLKKISALLGQELRDGKNFCFDITFGSFLRRDSSHREAIVNQLPMIRLDFEGPQNDLGQLYLNHNFDLLGSGWTRVEYGMKCRGLEQYRYSSAGKVTIDPGGMWLRGRVNAANLKEAQRIWRLIEAGYQPIDWQRDFKSGYRWQEATWYRQIRYGDQPGADIKLPWELARMQHLIVFAWCYGSKRSKTATAPGRDIYRREFRNQILDFIACNPPRFGVNWASPMDVAIRVVNWLIAYDLFKSCGAHFDQEFETIFKRSVYEHGRFCVANLEYRPEFRNNHYLADVAGIFFCAAYLPRSRETDGWLAFGLQELIAEMDWQFQADGSNFEASTAYHCLATEIMFYCSLLGLKLPEEKRSALQNYDSAVMRLTPGLKPPAEQVFDPGKPELFPAWYWQRLERASEMVMDLTKPTGEITQVGDNDSGRFVKLWPSFTKRTAAEAIKMYRNLADYKIQSPEADYWDENPFQFTQLAIMAGRLQDQHIRSFRENGVFHFTVKNHGNVAVADWLERLSGEIGEPVITEFAVTDPSLHLSAVRTVAYPEFGIYIYRMPRFFLALRCGAIGQNGRGGHAHNDQLSAELYMNGKEVVRDPGSYLYTPLPERRNQFRATTAHFTPQVGGKEQNPWPPGGKGLFRLEDRARAECLYFAADGFVGRHHGFGKPVYRVVLLCLAAVSFYDFGVESVTVPNINSRGYGKWVN